MLKRLLVAGLALGPATLAFHSLVSTHATTEFVLAAVSLVPLAWLIGEATEHAADHTGPGLGGFLNATFGNAPELIIALIALNRGLNDVVRGSLVGSVVGNLLLVLGFSLIAGKDAELDRVSTAVSLGLIGVALDCSSGRRSRAGTATRTGTRSRCGRFPSRAYSLRSTSSRRGARCVATASSTRERTTRWRGGRSRCRSACSAPRRSVQRL